jgi:hypothetical protein
MMVDPEDREHMLVAIVMKNAKAEAHWRSLSPEHDATWDELAASVGRIHARGMTVEIPHTTAG